jgi:hypothetical protein
VAAATVWEGELAALVGTADGCIKLDSRDHETLVGALTRLTHAVEGLPHRLEALETEEADVELQLGQCVSSKGWSGSGGSPT